MIEIDFSQGFFENNYRQLGKCGVSDHHRKFHTITYGICTSENCVDAKRIIDYTTILLQKYAQCTVTSMICDGSKALTKAKDHCKEDLNLLDCFAHISRPLRSRGYGNSGARGSVARYLVSHGTHIDLIISIMFDFFAMRHLNTLTEWKTARYLFKEQHRFLQDSQFDHFWNYYLPEQPRWGNVPHHCGEIHSVQGLEKSWDYDKDSFKLQKSLTRGKGYDLHHIFGGISNR